MGSTFKQPWRSRMQVTKVKLGWSHRPKKTAWSWWIYDPSSHPILHGKPRNPLGVAPWQHPKHVAMGSPCSSYWFPSRDSLLLSWVSRLNYTAQASPVACFTSLIQESLGKLAFKEPRVHSRRNSENWFTPIFGSLKARPVSITKSSVHQLHEPNSGTWQLKKHRPSHSFFVFPRAHWLVVH